MKIELEGYDIDNLLKTLYLKKVTISNLNKTDYKNASFEIQDKDFKKVKRYIKNFKTNITHNFFKRLPKIIVANVGILIAVFLGSIFALFCSTYTWQIKVYGTSDLSESDIINVLKDNGIKTGKINMISSEDVEAILLNNYDRIAQVSVIKRGTAIIINLSEKLIYIEEEFEPITAKFKGIITDISLITGTINVKVGDYVNVGDMLVLPFILDKEGNKISIRPMAEIKANMFVLGMCELQKIEQILVPTGKFTVTYNYKLFNFNLFSGKTKNSFALFNTTMYNENISDLVPFKRQIITYYELEVCNIEHDFELEKSALIDQSKVLAYKSLVGVDGILSENTTTIIVNDKLIATTTITFAGIIND